MKEDMLKWDEKHLKDFMPNSQSEFLVKCVQTLPKGRVLDIACGNGRNAKFLADRGFVCECIDISPVAINKLVNIPNIIPLCLDLDHYEIIPDHYEVILDFYFLDRRLFEGIKKGLKVGGVFLMETFIKNDSYPANIHEEKILQEGELQEMFWNFDILYYDKKLINRSGKNIQAVQFCAKKRSE
ncbi:hypothetical protein BKH42_00640 [Helicobacter sp. 13S00482-2]|uniref:class I SAM-dependent methyltransferase n=1 Tax=Helicobacter sp. 13S00482-2 TaxID=1476200 RepID=UPI000BA5B6FA|nr:methyltransferase domain-containing protein [Helicobacter sp. 13S00482-2]PAF54453.1 hypothetical protein BKH42_00640 [Helicobacter sp. 13S00482-2]